MDSGTWIEKGLSRRRKVACQSLVRRSDAAAFLWARRARRGPDSREYLPGDPVELDHWLVTDQPVDFSLNEVAPHRVRAGLKRGGSPIGFSDFTYRSPHEQRGLDVAAKLPECEGPLSVEGVLEWAGARGVLAREQVCRLVWAHRIRANGSPKIAGERVRGATTAADVRERIEKAAPFFLAPG
jgi:hypothetical protein